MRSLPSRLRRITEGGGYRAEIDGLRFIAILTVIPWHLAETVFRAQQKLSPVSVRDRSLLELLPEAVSGVMLFFALSGYMIANQFLRAEKRNTKLDLGHYVYRRITRIEPPYLLILLCSYAVLMSTPFRPENMVSFWSGPASFTESLWASLVYAHSVIFNARPRLFPGGWSLEIEIHFYILAPVIMGVLLRFASVSRRMLIALAGLALATVVSSHLNYAWGQAGPHRYTILRYAPYFLLGISLSLAEVDNLIPAMGSRAWTTLWLVGLALFLVLASLQHTVRSSQWLVYDFLRLGSISAIIVGASRSLLARSILSSPWIALLGGACYSIYLTHWQIIKVLTPMVVRILGRGNVFEALLLTTLIELPVIIVLGLVFYVTVERVFMIPDWPRKVWGRLFRSSASPAADEGGADVVR